MRRPPSLGIDRSWNGETSDFEGVLTRATRRLDRERQLQVQSRPGGERVGNRPAIPKQSHGSSKRPLHDLRVYPRANWLQPHIDAHRERTPRLDRPGASLACAVAAQRIESRRGRPGGEHNTSCASPPAFSFPPPTSNGPEVRGRCAWPHHRTGLAPRSLSGLLALHVATALIAAS